MKNERRPKDAKGIPCAICGSRTSAADFVFGDKTRVICVANSSGRDRCREREMSLDEFMERHYPEVVIR